MLKIARWIIGHFAMFPFALLYRIIGICSNENAANRIIGNTLTKVSALFVGLGIPRIHGPDEYQKFREKIQRNFQMYHLLYDVEVAGSTAESIEFRILNCPFTSALKKMGVPELCKFACAGDFLLAKRNKSKWKFSRTHSHGTDGHCCNHTYCSLNSILKTETKD